MKWIIMCGGTYQPFVTEFRPFIKIKGERLIDRTIRLLKELGQDDVAVSVPLDCDLMDDIGVEVLKINNDFGFKEEYSTFIGSYADAFYITDEPVIYINGDTFYTKEALQEILDTETDDIVFFGTAKPFPVGYNKAYREHLGFKVVNQKRFHEGLQKFRDLENMGRANWPFIRTPLFWELAMVLSNDDLHELKEEPGIFKGIHSFANDVDYDFEIPELEKTIEENCII